MQKRGQITIFIIIAIVIVAAAVIIFLFWPKINSTLFQAQDPQTFIEDCLNLELEKNIQLIAKQGGSLNPEHYALHEGDKVDYVCYTADDYVTCYMQKPLFKQDVEQEIKNSIKSKLNSCFDELEQNVKDDGNTITITKKDYSVEIFPKRIRTNIDYIISISNSQGTSNYDDINLDLNNNLYDLISVATSIANWEARYGDAETTVYMTYYPNIKVEKVKLNDGSKVYIITDRNSKEELKIASRSVVFPPGYG